MSVSTKLFTVAVLLLLAAATAADVRRNNMHIIAKHNAASHSFQLAPNDFIDMTQDEFRSKMLHRSTSTRPAAATLPVPSAAEVATLPKSVDWRSKCGPVQNQGALGSSLDVVAAEAISAANAIATGHYVAASAPYIHMCAPSSAMSMDALFQWAIKTGGVCSGDAGSCSCDKDVKISTAGNVAAGNSVALKAAVAKGPVAAAIDAGSTSFQFYDSGIINSTSCGTTLDHEVLIVGYGTTNQQDWWLVQNSWGASWGMNGYAMIARDDDTKAPGMCGIAMDATYCSSTKGTKGTKL